jgi:hypothetical protein
MEGGWKAEYQTYCQFISQTRIVINKRNKKVQKSKNPKKSKKIQNRTISQKHAKAQTNLKSSALNAVVFSFTD